MNEEIYHEGQPILYTGKRLENAKGAMILLRGRGSTASDITSLVGKLHQPEFAFLAPQAKSGSWYPNRFIAPVAENEPFLTSALRAITNVITIINKTGIQTRRVILLGFSQGACLALEYSARYPQRYGGVVGLSGGLIGDRIPEYSGSLNLTPVFLGCSESDPHIPKLRVQQSATVFRQLGANLDTRFYANLGHSVNDEELGIIDEMMTKIIEE